ncbi:MAG: hypothetical protein ACYCWW_00160 [Deltaproteobacteria bacterium]
MNAVQKLLDDPKVQSAIEGLVRDVCFGVETILNTAIEQIPVIGGIAETLIQPLEQEGVAAVEGEVAKLVGATPSVAGPVTAILEAPGVQKPSIAQLVEAGVKTELSKLFGGSKAPTAAKPLASTPNPGVRQMSYGPTPAKK